MENIYKGPPQFIFLEFLEGEINGLLFGLRREFNESDSDTDIHITVRGPYYTRIPADEISRCQAKLADSPILLEGFDLFENDGQFIVYMKVASPRLRDIWWKPEYPVEKYGFNPHISLYKGRNEKLARAILTFLRSQNIKLLSTNFKLTQFASKQHEMFPYEKAPRSPQFLSLSNRRLVKADILQKAANLVKSVKDSQGNTSANSNHSNF